MGKLISAIIFILTLLIPTGYVLKKAVVIVAKSAAKIAASLKHSTTRVAGQVTTGATAKAATATARVQQKAHAAGQKAKEILQSDQARRALATAAVTAGAAELGTFAYNNLNEDSDAGNAYADTTPTERVTPRPLPEPKPERERHRSVRLADPDKL